MSKRHTGTGGKASSKPAGAGSAWLIILVVIAAGTGLAMWLSQRGKPASPLPAPVSTNSISAAEGNAALPTNEVAQAIMVTVELDFAGQPTSIKDALRQVERRHEPADGQGRTFAILDAYGGPTPSGKIHMSMHVSMEKPGTGSLIFKRTGEVLWKSRIAPSPSGPAKARNLTVIMDDKTTGTSMMLDGSKGVPKVLDVPLHNSPSRVRDLWGDGTEREFTFIYSACGCPVKAMVRRTGETTARSTDTPVMFPDDPAALAVIHGLMGWPAPQP